MLAEEGTVVALEGDLAVVSKAKDAACHGCPQQGSCVSASLCDQEQVLVRVVNTLGARPGDRVLLGVDRLSPALKQTLYLLLPLLALVAGGIIGRWLGGDRHQWAATAGGLGSLVLAAAGLHAYFQHRERQRRAPVMRQIIGSQ